MRKHTGVALIILMLAFLTGCADFKTYMKDRGNDLADCFTARAGLCYGLGVRTQLTNYFGASIGLSLWEGKKGVYGRNPFAQQPSLMKSEGWIGMPFPQIFAFIAPFADPYSEESWYQKLDKIIYLLPVTDIRRSERQLPGAFNILGINVGEFTDVEAVEFKRKQMTPSVPFLREKFFFEVSATLGAVGFDIGFNPVEFVDFLLGWTTLDITSDDFKGKPVIPEKPREKSTP